MEQKCLRAETCMKIVCSKREFYGIFLDECRGGEMCAEKLFIYKYESKNMTNHFLLVCEEKGEILVIVRE